MNRYKAHLCVIPEDDANRDIANGFKAALNDPPQLYIPPEGVGGWRHTLPRFANDYESSLRRYLYRHVVILIDCDEDVGRLEWLRGQIPDDLHARVFVLGAFDEPEDLTRAGLGSYEHIGRRLAADCINGTMAVWSHDQLRHNGEEAQRLRTALPGLFA
jgi:hypothetical protein